VVYGAQCSGFSHPGRFLECTDEAEDVSHLGDETLVLRECAQSRSVGQVQHEWLFAEHVQPTLQRLLHHRSVQLGRRRNDHGAELLFSEHAIEVGMAFEVRVLAENVSQITRRVARGDELHVRVRPNDRKMGEPHLA